MDRRLYPGGSVDKPELWAEITVGEEATNVRAITIQLKNDEGADVTSRRVVDILVLADANGDALASTGGSTGIAIGTDGTILVTVTSKKVFKVISEADGDIDLTWTDTGTEACYLAVVQSDGSLAISSALTNA
jgi:hypothetical protein